MKVAIDLDGVLGDVVAPGVVAVWPATVLLAELIEALRDAGHEVICITACCGTEEDPEAYRSLRQGHLGVLGISFAWDELILVRHNEKGPTCHRLRVDVMVDDQPGNLAQIAQASPRTMCLHFAHAPTEAAAVGRGDR